MNGRKFLITGGIKSGKSDYALKIGGSAPGEKFFVATAQPLDKEMRLRIEKHKLSRSDKWKTIEEPRDISGTLGRGESGVFLIDCLTVWTSNLLINTEEEKFREETRRLAEAIQNFKGTVILVTNEVGLGIIPANAQSRMYGDRLGLLNQEMAAICDEVIMLVAGLPIVIKGTK